MRISRRMLPLTALLGLAVWGCQSGPGPVQPPVNSASPSASAPAPDASNSASPAASASVTPSGAPSLAPVPLETLRGTVYDDEGDELSTGSVRVRSLNPGRPFETTVQVIDGKYVVNQVPTETQIEITAFRAGWTSRSRVEALSLNVNNIQNRNVVNFGGPYDTVDPAGFAYFISNRPEIERVEPSDDASMVSNEQMSFKLTMSEPLDVVNQRRLASAFLIVPNNREALGETATLPQPSATDTASATASELEGLNAGPTPLTTSAYQFRQNSGFLNGYEVSEFKWDADGRTATFTLKAPLKTDRTEEAEYAFLLVQADDDPIVDAERLELGMNDNGTFGGTEPGDVLRNAIKEPELSLAQGQADDEEERWANTHLSFSRFSVAPDTTSPTLVSVVARRNYAEGAGNVVDRIELTFSEAMIAYPQISSRHLLSLNNYVLTAAETQEAVDARPLKSGGEAIDLRPGDLVQTVRDAIASTNGAVIGENGSLAPTSAGSYSIALSVKDPRVVVLQLPGGYLPLDANFIRIYAGSDDGAVQGTGGFVQDPAGNNIRDSVKTGPIY